NFLGHFALRLGRRRLFGESRGVFFARFNVTEHRADRIGFLYLSVDFRDLARARCRYTHHCLVGFDLDDFLIGGDFFARLHVDRDNRRLGDRFAELWHDDWNLGHKFIREVTAALSLRSIWRWAGASTRDWDGRE